MKILISKPDALGDQVLATGFVQAIRRCWPDAKIAWHVRSGMEVIARLLDGADVFTPNFSAEARQEAGRLWTQVHSPIVVVPLPIHPFADWTPELPEQYRWWAEFLRSTEWALAVAPMVNRSGLSDFTVAVSGASTKAGFRPNGASQPMLEAAFTLLPEPGARFTLEVASSLEESEWTQLQRLLDAIAPGQTLAPPSLRTAARDEIALLLPETESLALIAPGVGLHQQRAWPVSRFGQIASELRARGYAVRWLEGPQDAVYFRDLPPADVDARLSLPPTRLDLLAAAIQRAAVLVCNDTSYVHLGAALGTPTVAVFGAGQKARFIPPFGRVRVVQGDPVCRGCQWQCAFDRLLCVQEVPYEPVWQAVQTQLAGPGSAHQKQSISLPFSGQPDSIEHIEAVRDWYQQELARLRWDGWARLQVIRDANVRMRQRDHRIAELSVSSHLAVQAALGPAPLPKISVIVPMGRPERAEATFAALAGQSLHPEKWEVIVVGVGASRLPAKHPELPLVPVDLPHNLLPPRTRTEGVARATGEWYVFVDDDVRLAPDFFAMLSRVLALPCPASAADQTPVGAIGVRLPGGHGTFFEHLTDISNFWSQQSPRRAVPHSVWFLYSAAIVIRAEAYHRAGGFNPELPNGEDVDLTQRIASAGYHLAYEPSLVAYHYHGRDSLLRMWRYFWRNGNTAQYFFGQVGGVCCFSLRTALVRAWRDLQMNRGFQRSQGGRLGRDIPWILINYLIFEHSLEWHYQRYLWTTGRYQELPARTASDRTTVAAFGDLKEGRRLRGIARYAFAMVQSLADPVRR